MKTPTKTDAPIMEAPETINSLNIADFAVPVTEEYDGIEMYVGDRETKPMKINMNTSEMKKFIGDNDAAIYFREGKIPTYYKQLGQLLDDEREEVKVLKESLPQYPGLLLFKHLQQSLYTILVPKIYGEFELDAQGEIRDHNVKCDTRAVAFGGNGMPAAYETGAFKKSLAKFEKHFQSNFSRNKRA